MVVGTTSNKWPALESIFNMVGRSVVVVVVGVVLEWVSEGKEGWELGWGAKKIAKKNSPGTILPPSTARQYLPAGASGGALLAVARHLRPA